MKRVVSSGSTGNASSTSSNYTDPSFSEAVIHWQKRHGRHQLPWQQSKDAYRVWLSEIMLQQTQVTAVIPYYQRFLNSFPDVHSLADASSEQVMSLWSGLGYYTRARNLHACAKRVVQEYDGAFPSDPALLADLPGIGRSTAAAIAAFSYGTRAAILDGNVKRVFTRVFGIDGFPGSKVVETDLWLRAEALLPEENIQSYTQGLMDLGATLCTRTKPRCTDCPLQQRCVALAGDRIGELPAKAPKKKVPTRQINMLVIIDARKNVLLEKRPGTGIWGGLFSLPELAYQADESLTQTHQSIGKAVEGFGEPGAIQALPPFAHGFTHFKLEISPYQCELKKSAYAVSDDTHVWISLAEIESAPLPAPVKKLLGWVANAIAN